MMTQVQGLLPDDVTVSARYVLAQPNCYNEMNLITWQWCAATRCWISCFGTMPFSYAPNELTQGNWSIVERSDEMIYDVKNMWGQRVTPAQCV